MKTLRPRFSLFWLGLTVVLVIAGSLRLMSYRFSLPYVDHVDEPAYYLGGQEWRGLYDSGGYYDGIPPAYVAVHAVFQPILEANGKSGLAPAVEFLRLVAVIINLLTLIFIALTARLGSGDFAGLIAGAAWGASPMVLENGVYALPDPFIYFFTVLALWFAVIALLQPVRRHWTVWSVIAGLLAVLMKYPALPALIPGVLVTLVLMMHERRNWRWLALEIVLIAAAGIWLIFVYGIDFNNLQREGATVKSEGLHNFLDLSRVGHNVFQSLAPLNANAMLVVAALGLVAYLVARQRSLPRVLTGVIGLSLSLVIAFPWLASSYSQVNAGTIRYVLPATAAMCVIAGMAAWQIASVVTRLVTSHRTEGVQSTRWLWSSELLLTALLIVVAWIPQLRSDWALVQERQQPDRRAELRQWFDINFDPGTVIVDESNHKTFNPLWGGVPYRRWVDWWISNDIMEHPLEEWVQQRGMSYAALPKGEVNEMEATPEGQSYLAQMLHLRDFLTPQQRGPAMVFYRLWRMQIETDIQFGDHIHLLGYDLSNKQAKPGDSLTFRFYWQATAMPTDNYSLFIHLVPLADDAPVAQADGAPAVAERPTLSWNDPSETLISAPFSLVIPVDLTAGTYRVQIGLYNYVSGQRLTVQGADGSPVGDTYRLVNIIVAA